MSYCRSTGSVEFQWIDAYNHPLFIDAINDVDWSEGPQPSDGSFWEFFSGTWTSDGGQTDEASVRVAPTLRLRPTSTPVEPSGTGDYVLELLDDDAAVLKSVRFAASVAVGDVGPQGDAEPLSERWVVSVKNPPDYASYRIQRRSEVIATVERSSTAPAVAVTAPTAGQVLSADTMEFTWTGSDADGDTLSYTVQYSIDGGVNYKTIALGHNSTRLLRDRRSLAGSARARIRVIASDGARSTTAESAVFTVAASPPEVFISSPGDGSLLAGPQTLVLQAAAYDPEDGAVGASSIQWSSSLDGQLGMGGLVEVATADLSVGTHVLTATATDSSAATGSASVTVAVKRNNTAPSALDDIVYTSGRGSAVTADVAANDSDPDGDLDSYTIAVLVRPSAGTASAHGSAGEGHTITYSPAGGYDALIYSVCDLAGQCTTAELAVVAPPDG